MSSNTQLTEFLHSLRGMFQEPEYHFPIVAAQYQYRARYYGLAGAAMLEDLFFDAFSGYLRKSEPTANLLRPPRGEKGYDYEFNGMRMSHKVSKAGPVNIAALWDATRLDVHEWTFEHPINFTSSGYSKAMIKATRVHDKKNLQFVPASSIQKLETGDSLTLVRWSLEKTFQIVHIWGVSSSSDIRSQLPFRELWKVVAIEAAIQTRANQLELFVVKRKSKLKVEEGEAFYPNEDCFRPGSYLFDQVGLTRIPVTHNNRAILIPKAFVAALMHQSLNDGNFVPSTTWFSVYAGLNPPDLYLAQKADYDQKFSIYTSQT